MESGNGYVIQVKGNQPKLKTAILELFINEKYINTYISQEKNRGRSEKRVYTRYAITDNPTFKLWAGLNTIIRVVSSGVRNNKEYKEERYYISSEQDTPIKKIAEGIRKHWGIENKLHWTKDKILNEDNSLVRSKNRAKTLSWLRQVIISIYKINGCRSIKYAIERHANRPEKIISLITKQKHI